ncbi:MAG: hypothetical protein JNK87_31225 [Bryobacterales bacterium]|nr:hypothetical protein [Bryobacterales bacterium]
MSAGNGRWEMISLGARAAYSYDPFTGEELWRVEERAQHSASTRPVLGHGMVYFPNRLLRPPTAGCAPGGNGLLTDTHVAWRSNGVCPSLWRVPGAIAEFRELQRGRLGFNRKQAATLRGNVAYRIGSASSRIAAKDNR